jgi:hypothetical protein
MSKQTEFEFQYDQAGNLKSGRSITKSIRLDYDYYGRWYQNPANANKMIKNGNCYSYPGVQFGSYKEFKHSGTFKQRAELVASDYISQRTGWELNRTTGQTWRRMLEDKHGRDWTHAWGQRYVRRIAKLLKANGMK